MNLEILGREFLNELVNYADYHNRAKATREIREIILRTAMLANTFQTLDYDAVEKTMEELDKNLRKKSRKHNTKKDSDRPCKHH